MPVSSRHDRHNIVSRAAHPDKEKCIYYTTLRPYRRMMNNLIKGTICNAGRHPAGKTAEMKAKVTSVIKF